MFYRKLKKLPKYIKFSAIKYVNLCIFQYIPIVDHKKHIDYERAPLVIILGAPRCGSTYLYQRVINELEVTYISNIHNFIYTNFYIASMVFYIVKRCGSKRVRYDSNFGKVSGLASPSEGGKFWNHYFNGELKGDLIKAKQDFLMRDLDVMRRRGRPVVVKNLFNLHRVSFLRTLQNVKFVILTRKVETNAISIEKAYDVFDTPDDEWFSVSADASTPEYSSDRQKAIAQVEKINELLYKFFSERGSQKIDYISISYEEYTGDKSTETMERLRKFIFSSGS